jgi:hypothetical protein
VINYRDISKRLAAIGKERPWLAKQLNLSPNTIRQYLGPKGKRTKELMEEIERVIVLEEARQRENQADAPPWSVIFKTAEECRNVLCKRANEILAQKSNTAYPSAPPKNLRAVTKVADETQNGD